MDRVREEAALVTECNWSCLGLDNLESIGLFSNLTTLDLSFNNLSTLPEDVTNLQHLTYLNIAGNRFEYLPRHIMKLVSLGRLQLNVAGNYNLRDPKDSSRSFFRY